MPDTVTVRVPATSANLGPGFDSLGLALDLTQDVVVSTRPIEGAGGPLARLVADAARAAYRVARRPTPDELHVRCPAVIPPGRGLGASAAARAAGIVAANELAGLGLPPAQMLKLGADLEGHADNIAPALFGGFRVVVRTDGEWVHIAVPVAAGLRVVLFVPDFEMPTNESRKLLPQSISRQDAVHNIGRAALLVAALAAGEWRLLDEATQDRIHQPARAQLFPAMTQIFAAAKDADALCAYLSGGGSTVAAFVVEREQDVASAMSDRARALGHSGRAVVCGPSATGAEIIARDEM